MAAVSRQPYFQLAFGQAPPPSGDTPQRRRLTFEERGEIDTRRTGAGVLSDFDKNSVIVKPQILNMDQLGMTVTTVN